MQLLRVVILLLDCVEAECDMPTCVNCVGFDDDLPRGWRDWIVLMLWRIDHR